MPSILQYILSGLASLLVSQIKDHKTDIEAAIMKLLDQILGGLKLSGNEDTVAKLKQFVADHE